MDYSTNNVSPFAFHIPFISALQYINKTDPECKLSCTVVEDCNKVQVKKENRDYIYTYNIVYKGTNASGSTLEFVKDYHKKYLDNFNKKYDFDNKPNSISNIYNEASYIPNICIFSYSETNDIVCTDSSFTVKFPFSIAMEKLPENPINLSANIQILISLLDINCKFISQPILGIDLVQFKYIKSIPTQTSYNPTLLSSVYPIYHSALYTYSLFSNILDTQFSFNLDIYTILEPGIFTTEDNINMYSIDIINANCNTLLKNYFDNSFHREKSIIVYLRSIVDGITRLVPHFFYEKSTDENLFTKLNLVCGYGSNINKALILDVPSKDFIEYIDLVKAKANTKDCAVVNNIIDIVTQIYKNIFVDCTVQKYIIENNLNLYKNTQIHATSTALTTMYSTGLDEISMKIFDSLTRYTYLPKSNITLAWLKAIITFSKYTSSNPLSTIVTDILVNKNYSSSSNAVFSDYFNIIWTQVFNGILGDDCVSTAHVDLIGGLNQNEVNTWEMPDIRLLFKESGNFRSIGNPLSLLCNKGNNYEKYCFPNFDNICNFRNDHNLPNKYTPFIKNGDNFKDIIKLCIKEGKIVVSDFVAKANKFAIEETTSKMYYYFGDKKRAFYDFDPERSESYWSIFRISFNLGGMNYNSTPKIEKILKAMGINSNFKVLPEQIRKWCEVTGSNLSKLKRNFENSKYFKQFKKNGNKYFNPKLDKDNLELFSNKLKFLFPQEVNKIINKNLNSLEIQAMLWYGLKPLNSIKLCKMALIRHIKANPEVGAILLDSILYNKLYQSYAIPEYINRIKKYIKVFNISVPTGFEKSCELFLKHSEYLHNTIQGEALDIKQVITPFLKSLNNDKYSKDFSEFSKLLKNIDDRITINDYVYETSKYILPIKIEDEEEPILGALNLHVDKESIKELVNSEEYKAFISKALKVYLK